MADSKKPSTADILNLLRKQGAGDAPGKPAEVPAEPPPAEPTAEPAAEAPPEPKPFREPLPSEVAKPATKLAGKPSDIMAAIRGGGGAAAAAPKSDASANPSSSADILAAARAKVPAAGGDKPKGAADILAAARGGGAAPKTAAAAKEGVAKPAAKAAADVSGRDPKELVQALRTGKTGTAVAEAPRKPKLPPPKLSAAATAVPRRSFAVAFLEAMMAPFVIGWSVFAFIIGLSTLLTARFMMPNTVLELPSRFKIGPASDFPPETVSEKFKAARGVWIVNTAGYDGEQIVYALASVCTHLGCTPNWLEGEQKFKCPCHGSGFYITGINFEGPAPRPLERVGISVSADGMLEVDKSMKFQEELGQWSDGKSYHPV